MKQVYKLEKEINVRLTLEIELILIGVSEKSYHFINDDFFYMVQIETIICRYVLNKDNRVKLLEYTFSVL